MALHKREAHEFELHLVQEDIPPELLPANPDIAAASAAEAACLEALQPTVFAGGRTEAASSNAAEVRRSSSASTQAAAPLGDAQLPAANGARPPPSRASKAASDDAASTVPEATQSAGQPIAVHSVAPGSLPTPAAQTTRSPSEAGAIAGVSAAPPVAQQAAAQKGPHSHAALPVTSPSHPTPGSQTARPPLQSSTGAAASAPQPVAQQAAAQRALQKDTRAHVAAKPGEPKPVFPVPLTVEEEVEHVADAVLRAWRAGVRRQMLQLMLPLSQVRVCCRVVACASRLVAYLSCFHLVVT